LYNLSFEHTFGLVITLLFITFLGYFSGRNIKSSSDFSTGGRRADSSVIVGAITGTLVGGASTIGTAQLAFVSGLSAWWFTLGAGIGCLVLALFFAEPFYKMNKGTIPQILCDEYGQIAGPISSIFVSIGMFLNIVAQVLSAVALITSMFKMLPFSAAVIAILIMATYVIFGGVWGAGIVGVAKLLLLYLAMLVGGIISYKGLGGLSGIFSTFPANPYFNLFGRGFWVDFAAGFSLVIGVISTQTYFQAVVSGKSVKEAKKGALISAIIIPPIGIAGILIGLYMKANFPNINPASALPLFVINHLNPWLGGVILATLLIAVAGTGSGLTLGISTIFAKDIYAKFINPKANDGVLLRVTRLSIIAVLSITLLFITGNLKSLILKWSFMSMGLRGATVFAPLCAAIFMRGRVDRRFAILSMVISPLTVLVGKFILPENIDPLIPGILIGMLLIFAGALFNKRTPKNKTQMA